jgi:hypothetical protein
LGFGVWGLGFGVWDGLCVVPCQELRFRVQGLKLKVQSLGFRVGLGFSTQGLEFRVLSL